MTNNFPLKIHSDELYLEAFAKENQLSLWKAIQEDRVHPKRKGIWPRMKTMEDLRVYMESCNNADSEEYGYLIYDKASNQLGTAHVFDIDKYSGQCEIGFGLHIIHTGRGWATRTVGLLESELRKIGFSRIVMHCQIWNEKSLAVAARANYERVKTFHKGQDNCAGCDDCTVQLVKIIGSDL